jgi:serine/threonine protein kinase
MNTKQSKIDIRDDKIVKTYKDIEINKMSSIENEVECIKRFSNSSHCPKILKFDGSKSYVMERYDFDIGSTRTIDVKRVRRLLFYLPIKNIEKQLREIAEDLKKCGLRHRDVNPGNLMFSIKDNKIKLIDFYWTLIGEYEPPESPKNLNSIYGLNDQKAIDEIIKQIANVNDVLCKEVADIKKNIGNMGKSYYDGSATKVGKTYHRVPIYFFDDIPFHKDISDDFNEVIKNITEEPKTVVDIGCAAGYYTFNLFKLFRIKKITAYEQDPVMLGILNSIKQSFCLDEIEFINGIKTNSKIESTDLTICMNVHMWLVKQNGKDGANTIMRNLISNSKLMFFQTTGKDASKYIVDWLKNKDDIEKYLYSLGAKRVKFIRTTHIHKADRHLFCIS